MFSTYYNFSLPLFHSSPFSSPRQQRTPPLSLHSFSSLSFPISSPPLPSLPSGRAIHARPAGRCGSSTAGRRGSSVRDIHARGARPRACRSPPTLPLPSMLLPLLAPTLAPLRPFPLLPLALLPYRSAVAAGTASSRRAWQRRERRARRRRQWQVRRRRERRDPARCHANRPL